MKEADIKKFNPVTGIVVYRKEKDYYLQAHEIHNDGGRFTWGAGKAFQRDHLKDLVLSLKKENFTALKLKGLMPAKLLYFQPDISETKLIWYVEPKKHFLQFNYQGLKDGNYFLPGLIFAVSDRTLYVYAFRGKERPTSQTELYHAPLFNISANGTVCMGTISESRKKKFLEEEMDRWERRFFGGVFTSAHWSDSRLTKGTLKDALKLAFNRAEFHETLLTKNKAGTIEQFLKTFTKNNEIEDHDDDE